MVNILLHSEMNTGVLNPKVNSQNVYHDDRSLLVGILLRAEKAKCVVHITTVK